MITRLDRERIFEAEVKRLAEYYGLECFLDYCVDVDTYEDVFIVDFTHHGLKEHKRFEFHNDTLHELKDMVKAWVNDILGIEEKEPEPVIEKPIDPLAKIAKQLRIANELKIIELKYEYTDDYFKDDANRDIQRIEKELKGED